MLGVWDDEESSHRHPWFDVGGLQRWAVAGLWGRKRRQTYPPDLLISSMTRNPELDMYLDTEPLLPGNNTSISSNRDKEEVGSVRTHRCIRLIITILAVALPISLILSVPTIVQMQMQSANVSFLEINATFPRDAPAHHPNVFSPLRSNVTFPKQWGGGSSASVEKHRGTHDAIQLSALVDIPVPSYVSATAQGSEQMPLSLYFRGCRVGSLDISPLRVGSGCPSPLNLISVATVESMECFRAFSHEMLSEKAAAVTLSGGLSVCIRLGLVVCDFELCFPRIPVNRTIELGGMGGFPGATIESMDLSHSTKDELVASSQVLIWNPSLMQVSPLGAFAMNVSYGGLQIGAFRSSGWVDDIKRGKNLLSVEGSILSLKDQAVANAFISKFLTGGDVAMGTRITSSSIPLIMDALSELEIPVVMRQERGMDLLGGVELRAMDVVPLMPRGARLVSTLVIKVLSPLGKDSPVLVRSVAMLGGQLEYLGEVAASFAVPPVAVTTEGDAVVLSFSSQMVVNDKAFASLLVDMINLDIVTVTLRGLADANVTCALGDVTVDGLNVTRQVLLVGFGGLKNASVQSFDVTGQDARGGMIVSICARVSNPSMASARLGGIEFAVVYRGQALGLVTADVDVRQGENVLLMSGWIRPVTRPAMEAFEGFLGAYLRGETLLVEASGRGCAGECAQWVSELAGQLQLQVPLPGVSTEGMVTGVRIMASELEFDSDGHALLSGAFGAQWQLPWQVAFNLTRVGVRLSLRYGNATFGTADVPMQGCESDPITKTVNITVTRVPLTVTDSEGFSSFVQTLIASDYVTLTVSGSVDAVIGLPFGDVTPTGVPITAKLRVNGMSGLSSPTPVIGGLDVVGAVSENSLPVELNVSVYNPSVFEMDAGHVRFSVSVTGCEDGEGPIGIASVSRASFRRGWSQMSAKATLKGPTSPCAVQYLSNFINAVPSHLTLMSLPDPDGIPLVQAALQGFSLPVSASGLDQMLVHSANSYILDPVSVLKSKQIHCDIIVTNPLSAWIEILSINVNITTEGQALGTLKHDFVEPLRIPPNQEGRTKTVCVTLAKFVSLALLEAFFQAANTAQGAPMHVRGRAQVRIGEAFSTLLLLDQGPVPAFVVFRLPPTCEA